ncbi:SET domain-containing protein-lysine N-methyltransferase [Ferruginibacter sp. SUN106]|uniref:SET domain-containing protein-lysine N-methyltransferase n=1 Tax=Ferruginibacter sp. SUN106 TaxID=2978348 RepID=UPI003D36162D
MLHWFTKNKIRQPQGIAVQQSPLHGRGVFACKYFKPGAVIETAPVILLEKAERDFLQGTTLFSYYFVVADEKTPVALGLGYSSLYNHAYNANAVYSISLQGAAIIIKACKTIHAGDEITLNYNGSPDDTTPVYFPPEESTV